MKDKRYLKWYNKIGYGSGDAAANCAYATLAAFVMIYLTDTVGLDAGIVGTLIMLSKFFDGFTDVIFGSLIDRTRTKMGKARPWMLYSQIGVSLFLFLTFTIPSALSDGMKYAYFFITYTMLNAVFYTMNNIAYASLTSLITKNVNERVQLGSIRFMFAMATNILISSFTIVLVNNFGGGAAGWRTVALIYSLIALVINSIAVFSVKEIDVSSEEAALEKSLEKKPAADKISFGECFKLLFKNKYFIIIAVWYILNYINSGITGVGIYWMTYIYGQPEMLGAFSMASMIPIIVGLIFVPAVIKKFGSMYKINLVGYLVSLVFRVGFVIAGLKLNMPIMLACAAIAQLMTCPTVGDINALISEAADYTVRTTGKHIEGTMFSCSSVGIKVGGGLGSALAGILLSAGGYVLCEHAQLHVPVAPPRPWHRYDLPALPAQGGTGQCGMGCCAQRAVSYPETLSFRRRP